MLEMMDLWSWLAVGGLVAASFEFLVLNRKRRLLLLDPQRRRFFIRSARVSDRRRRRLGEPMNLELEGRTPSLPKPQHHHAALAEQRPPAPIPARVHRQGPDRQSARGDAPGSAVAAPWGLPTQPSTKPSPEGAALHEPEATAAADAAGLGLLYVDSEGHCAGANTAAQHLLGWDSGDLALSDLLVGGAAESAALLAALTREGFAPPYTSVLARRPATPVEIIAVALRDRDDNFWGAALFIHLLPAAAADPA